MKNSVESKGNVFKITQLGGGGEKKE